MSNEIINQLSVLKEKYQKHVVSVLVGAGFSKNACPAFPSWNELLYDMIVEMYQEEIESAFIRFQSLNPLITVSRAKFKEKESHRISSRIGYLKVVSDFISRNGFRESIEHYIEERIPYIDKVNNQFRFVGKNESKSLAIIPKNFAAHIKLIEGKCWERIYTTNYDRLLEHAVDMAEKHYSIITNARKLSVFSEAPSIIKLHGDLNNPTDGNPRKFKFDGNPHQQYIISEEDYKNYPKDHEAFTQLMRISLLQGYFCLIGFSGDDPNFLNWIEWVRDVLERETAKEGEELDYKIFLIGVSKEQPKQDKMMFFENHNIFYIPLLMDSVKKHIGAKPSDDIRTLFCRLFDFLEQNEVPLLENNIKDPGPINLAGSGSTDFKQEKELVSEQKSDEKETETVEKKEYLSLWNRVYELKISGTSLAYTHELIINEEILERLQHIKIWNRIVYSYHKQLYYLHLVNQKDRLSVPEAQLAILALKDTGTPIDQKLFDLISGSGINEPYLAELNRIIDRKETLLTSWNNKSDNQPVPYELIIRNLFYFNFEGAKTILDNWQPTGVDVLKKAVILSFMEDDSANSIIADFIKSESNAKEQFYATRLLNIVEQSTCSKHSITRYENANILDYFEVFSNYVKKVKENNENIGKYGDGKKKKVFYVDGKPNKIAESIAVLNFLIETPGLVSYRNFFVLLASNQWYLVHKNLFELFPYASLFYSIQCTDKKVQARIGQDYAYSDHLSETCLDKIIVCLLNAYLSKYTPAYLKQSILSISKELFVSVPSSEWEDCFMRIWKDEVLVYRFNHPNDSHYDVFDSFIDRGLNSLTNTAYRKKIIKDVLKNAKKDTGFAINCLYYLSVRKTNYQGDSSLRRSVDRFVSQMNLPEEITIAGNIFVILTDTQKSFVAEKCVSILQAEMGKKIDQVVYSSSQFFVKNNSFQRKTFVESVLANPLLWENGVLSSGGFGSFTYLKVTSFMHRIYLDKKNLFKIYDKMKESSEGVKEYVKHHKTMPAFGNVNGLLSEMLSFLNYYKKRLDKRDDFEETYNCVTGLLQKITGLKNTADGLLSSFEEDLRDALDFIYTNRDSLPHKEILTYVRIIINRVLLKNSDGLDLCNAYLRLFLNEGMIGKDDEDIMEGLINILDRYSKEEAQECNMELPMTVRDLSKIANVLTKYGYKSSGINYWKKLGNSKRFYTNFN